MRFSEHELTAALTGAAKSVLAIQDKSVRKGRADVDQVWEATDRYARYQLLDGLGTQLLPVLVALPDVEVEPGTRPTYTDQEVSTVVESLVPDDLGRVKRAVVVKARTALVQVALSHVPVRRDPDGLLFE